MQFYLFLLLNAALFLRPSDLFTELAGVSIYEPVILVCLAASAGPLLGCLTGRSLAGSPVTLCVLGLTVAVPLSHLAHSAFWEARSTGIQFVKITLYYLLLVTALRSTADLRRFLG